MKKTYYYCEKDSWGQKTGIIGQIKLSKEEYANYKEYFLYKSYESALYSALN